MAGTTVDILLHRLRHRGVRITGPRRMVLVALLESGSHVTAEQLLQRVQVDHPSASPSSIYRTMDLLSEHGIVEHVHLGHGPAQYHLTEDDHAHLVCDVCGAVIELDPATSQPFVEAVDASFDFQLDLSHFALTGRCASCRSVG